MFNTEAEVELGAHQVTPKAEFKFVGRWTDSKLRWGPHMKVQVKIIS